MNKEFVMHRIHQLKMVTTVLEDVAEGKVTLDTQRLADELLDDDKLLKDIGNLPATGLTPEEAMTIARWRFGRLPTLAEFNHALGGGASYKFPWGDRFQGYACNTAELDLDRLTAVGTFEPGDYASSSVA